MKFIIVLCSLFAISISSFALPVPAYKGKVRVKTDDGSVCIYIKGDENCKFAVTEDGYTLLQDTDGWYFANKDDDGNICLSPYKLLQKRNEETNNFLRNLEKGIQPIIKKTSKVKVNNTVSRDNAVARNSVIGTRRVLVVLMQFSDKKFVKKATEFDAMFNEPGYNIDGATGSVYDFYKTASYDQLTLVSDIYGPYTSKNPMSYYGGNSAVSGSDKNPKALFDEALEHLVKDADLSLYDSNKDGFIDNMHIIYAGYGEEAGATSKSIWAHQMTFSPITVQGLKVDRYSCSPELRGNSGNGISRIGVSCHEIGHALGALDYYDTDYTANGEFEGTGEWDVMAHGSWNNEGISPPDFNPYVKAYDFGWIDVRMLPEGSSTVIYPTSDSNFVYRVDTAVKNEFFLLENRAKKGINKHAPGEGLLIYHIDASIEKKAQKNVINASYPQACYPVCASSIFPMPDDSPVSYGNINGAGCPYPGSSNNSSFGKLSTPGAFCNNGEYSGVEIGDISKDNYNIILSYNRDGAIKGNTVWEENFEEIDFSPFWSIEGRGSWNVMKFLGGTASGEYPAVFSGKGYMVFTRVQNDNTIVDRINGNLISNEITLPKTKECNLNFSFCKRSSYANAADSLSVHIFGKEKKGMFGKEDEDNWVEAFTEKYEATREWQTVSLNLGRLYSDIRIEIRGNIHGGSSLFVDAMSVVENDETTGVIAENIESSERNSVDINICNGNLSINNPLNRNINVFIYNINGELLLSSAINSFTVQEISLPDGLYIVKADNKTQKMKIGVVK